MYSVVVLNRNYEYWTEVDLKKAIKWLVKDKIEVLVSKDDEEVRSFEVRFKIPLVVRLVHFVSYRIKSDRVPYSDHGVYNRDKNQCQYWHYTKDGKRFAYTCTENERTIDHVTPREKGGATSYENCVCCCRHHNVVVKRNKLPEEVGLELIRKPAVPTVRKGDYAVFRFAYNPNKISHRFYVDKILKPYVAGA